MSIFEIGRSRGASMLAQIVGIQSILTKVMSLITQKAIVQQKHK
jgi:hypothetical protein